MSATGISTRGYICGRPLSVLVSSEHPDAHTHTQAPEIEAHTVSPPKNIVESVPELKPRLRTCKPKKKRR